MATLLAAITTHSVADEFRQGEPLYVIVSSANVHTEPRMDSSIFVTLPIGAKVTFEDYCDKLTLPNCRTEVKPDDKKWISFSSDAITFEMDPPMLWIAADSLSRTPPQLDDLIAQYDKTPKENVSERRKWAERAVALKPLNPEAQKRLIDTLAEIPDQSALIAAKKSFEHYQAHQPNLAQGDIQRIFSYNGSLEPIVAGLKSGLVMPLEADENADFHNRGQFYYLYSHGRNVGYVVTEMRFNCAVHPCPQGIPARYIPLPNVDPHPWGIATNFPLPEKRVLDPITAQQKTMLLKMAKTWIDSSGLSKKGKNFFWNKINQPAFKSALDVGQLAKDGKIFLVGNWAIGSMNDQHYGAGGDDDFYESLLIIAEQQQDGTFKLAKGSGSLTDSGCSYSDHIDIDMDGTDEILLDCSGLEGSHGSRFLKRTGDNWKDMF